MDFQKKSFGEGGVLGGIKSKLGFSNNASEAYEDTYYDENQDYVDEFDGEYNDGFDDYDDNRGYSYRDNYAPAARGGYDNYSQRSYGSYNDDFGSISSRPARSSVNSVSSNLVSMEDVRARTQVPETLMRDPLDRSRTSLQNDADYGRFSPSQRSYAATNTFSSTASAKPAASASSIMPATSSAAPGLQPLPNVSSSPRKSFDPYDAFSGNGETKHTPARSLTVLKPISYGEVELIARNLRAGDVVVLSLKNTSDDLAKRILDFSFGAASMVDARVECVAEKVFAINSGAALSREEKVKLAAQGAL